ncbi:MAG: tricorn protease [Abditibacteriota bacterium]|nr:tricorn protease [Abditibacteriota bacterium]
MRSHSSRYALLLSLILPAFQPNPSAAQLPAPEEKAAVGARMPALSGDGEKLAFVYRGDIWVSGARGGRAYPVTDHIELDAYPLFSPDGKWLAFSSVRNGNWDIFVVPTNGGAVRQMTFSSFSEIATDWSPDGKTLLFSSQRDVPNSTVFALDVATLRFRKLDEDYKSLLWPAFSPDGQKIVFSRHGFPWYRPRYNGSAAAQLWTFDLKSRTRTALSNTQRQHLWPRFVLGGRAVIAVATGEATPNAQYLGKPLPPLVDNEARTPNLWIFSSDGQKPRQLTNFVGDGVRCPTVARVTGDVVFEHDSDLYYLPFSLPFGSQKPKKLELFCGVEDKQNNVSREVLSTGVEESEISPDGKTIAFGLKGDIWTIPIEKPKTRNADDATRLTEYAGFDRDFNWSADSKTLFFVSDRNFNNRIYALDIAGRALRPLWTGAADASNPKVSPDGKWLGFWVAGPAGEKGEGSGGLYVVPLTTDAKQPEAKQSNVPIGAPGTTSGTTAPRRILALPRAVQGQFSWSPDMKWIAFTRRGIESDGYNIWITPADGSGKAVNVTRLNAFHSQPTWSPDGKYLFFASNRDGDGLYVLPLKPEEARADELEIKFEKPKPQTEPAPGNKPVDKPKEDRPKDDTEPALKPESGANPAASETKAADTKAATPRRPVVNVEIDFEDTPQRIRKLTTQYPQDDLTITDEGQIYFLSAGDAWSCSYDGKEVKRLSTGGGLASLRAAADGKTLFFRRNGGLWKMRVGNDNPISAITFSAAWERDVRAERKAAFIEFWRSYNTRFYDGNFHGRNWAALRDRYEPLLDAVGTRDEFAVLLNRMVGELESSHSEVGPAPGAVAGPSTRHLGIYFDYAYDGPSIRVREVPKRAPGSYAKTQIKAGEYIVAIDGKDVTLDENLFKVLNDKGDKDFELLVNSKPIREGARTVKFKALSGDEWSDIHYRNRIERSRKLVESKSGGKLAYVHIQGMGLNNQINFDRELYEYAEGKDAVIIDVRFNGGGNISDTLINWLGTKPYGTYLPRDGYPEPAPGRGWRKPIVVLMNEHSMSNAEMFPYGMRAHGMAKLVGQTTPGYVIWTSDLRLVDGTRARMPGSGVFRADGSPMENVGEKPDIAVALSTEDWLTERDPQLETAIVQLMNKQATPIATSKAP